MSLSPKKADLEKALYLPGVREHSRHSIGSRKVDLGDWVSSTTRSTVRENL